MLNGAVEQKEGEVNGISMSCSDSKSDPPSASGCAVGVGSIEHRVSKMDTLAGIAIMYGVEVADIKRMNGLVTDLQMFAHDKLHIPQPGRHPPSPVLLSGSSSNRECTPRRNRQHHDDILDSLQSLKVNPKRRTSHAMSVLQGYYGLTPPEKSTAVEATGRNLFGTNGTLDSDGKFLELVTPHSQPPCQKSNGLLTEETIVSEAEGNGDVDISSTENSVRRRQKTDADYMNECSGRTVKSAVPRPKSGNRSDLNLAHTEALLIGDSFLADGFVRVRKSSSTSNLVDSSTKKTKPEAISKLLFDNSQKPLNSRRNKASID